jgi:hypothetical protein
VEKIPKTPDLLAQPAHLQRLAPRQLQHLLGSRSERDAPGRGLLALADDLLNLLADGLQADPQRLQRLGRGTLMDKTEQDVLSADVAVMERPGLMVAGTRPGTVIQGGNPAQRKRTRQLRDLGQVSSITRS